MKSIVCMLICCLMAGKALAQNCSVLDSASFFTSVRFGSPIPESMVTCSKSKVVVTSAYTSLRLEHSILSPACQKQYRDLFTFFSTPFAFTQIGTTRQGKISTIELYSFFDDNRLGDSTTYTPPPVFTDLYNGLRAVYGEPARTATPTKADSLFIREKGVEQVFAWNCNSILFQLRVVYGASDKMLNVLHVTISNRDYDLPEIEERIN